MLCLIPLVPIAHASGRRASSKTVTADEKQPDGLSVGSLIDHTIPKPDATVQDIAKACREALRFRFASVCVNPYWVPLALEGLAGSSIPVCTVVGFPLGANQTRTKFAEAELALMQGARELDMVQNVGALRTGDHAAVRSEIAAIASLCHAHRAILKVILETCLLTDEEKRTACQLAVEAEADFIKTSTGFAASGAAVDDVRLIRKAVGDKAGVKASGGIRTLTSVREMIDAGANRIGTSSGVKIVNELRGHGIETEPVPLNPVRLPGGNPDTY